MSIDLTGADEQDWMDGEAPPVRYSELTTADERVSDAVEQLREPLIEVLTAHYRSTEYSVSVLRRQTAELAAGMLVTRLDSRPDSSVEELFDSVAVPDSDESDWMDEYLHRVAQEAVARMSASSLKRIYSEAIMVAEGEIIHHQEESLPAAPDSLRGTPDAPQSE